MAEDKKSPDDQDPKDEKVTEASSASADDEAPDTVDAEIISESENSTSEETSEDVTASVTSDDPAEEASAEEKTETLAAASSSLSMPFAIIIALLVVAGALFFFLGRDHSEPASHSETRTAQTQDQNRPDLLATDDAEEEIPSPARDPLSAPATENQDDSQREPSERADITDSAAETISEMVAGNVTQTDEPTADDETRSTLLERAAERNRARREAREEQENAPRLGESHSDRPQTENLPVNRVSLPETEEVTEEVPTEANHSDSTPVTRTNVPSQINQQTARTPDTPDNIAAPSETLAPDLSAQIDGIKSDVREDVLNETQRAVQDVRAETQQEVDALRTELARQSRESEERINELNQRLEQLANREVIQARQNTMLLALSDLADAIDSGDPYTRELTALSRMVQNEALLGNLPAKANNGFVSNAELRASYQEVARAALSGAKRDTASGPFSRFMANLSGLFVVRKTGNVEGDNPSAIIARAEVALQNNDLNTVLIELRQLEGSALEAFTPWMEQVQEKVDTLEQVERLEEQLLSRAG